MKHGPEPTISRGPRTGILAFAAAALFAACAIGAEPARPPNLIVIMTDDQGYADVGFNGCKDIPTPNLDRIAHGGVKFTSAYVTFTVCAPSRAGFITGRYPQRFGFERNVPYEPNDPAIGLAKEETTIAQALRSRGYRSAIIGKWHLGAHENFHPLNRGFDEFFGHLGGGHQYFQEEFRFKGAKTAKNEPQSYRTWIERGFEPVPITRYLTEEFTHEAVEFVTRNQNNPFFLFLAYNAPHGPLQAPQSDIDAFAHIPNEKRRTYAAMVSIVDRGVGQLLDRLDELQLTENTLVFFLSDNGGPTFTNGSNNAPLRGSKSEVWEGGFRIPFAARWPAKIPAGITYEKPVSSMDIFATIAAVNSLELDPARPLDGANLLPYVRGETEAVPHERIYLRMFDRGTFAMREGNFKIVQQKSPAPPLLFNLAKDISERENLSETEPERLASMLTTYQSWSAQLIPPAFRGLNMREWEQPEKTDQSPATP